MDGDRHEGRHGTDVLIRKVDGHLTAVRVGLRGPELELAERVAATLRELVLDTTRASAADRARVRAAVHFFVLRREGRGPFLPVRSLAAARQVVNKVVMRLNRPDLLVPLVPGVSGEAPRVTVDLADATGDMTATGRCVSPPLSRRAR